MIYPAFVKFPISKYSKQRELRFSIGYCEAENNNYRFQEFSHSYNYIRLLYITLG